MSADLAAAISAQARASEAEDAARYRWLRNWWPQTILEDLLAKIPGRNPQAELDAAIDAARATQGDAGSRGETK